MKSIIISLILTTSYLTPGQATMAPAHKPVEAGPPVPKVLMLKPIEAPKFAELKPLELANFSYKPMGTYPNDYPDGQCTHGAASMKGNIPNWGNANEWDDNARAAGYTVSDVPIIGSVAVDNVGYYGHVAVVTDIGPGTVTVEEMNYDWNGSVRSFTYPVGTFVYIYM